MPREYQPQTLSPSDGSALTRVVDEQIDIYEEEYVDLEDQGEVDKYADLLLTESSSSGAYSSDIRSAFVNELVQIGELNMSQDNINISHTSGIVNVKSQLKHVSQKINDAASLSDSSKVELSRLVVELHNSLEAIRTERPDDVERIANSTELVVSEATAKNPNHGFLHITADGLKEAAKAVSDIAPTVLSTALRVAEFVTKI